MTVVRAFMVESELPGAANPWRLETTTRTRAKADKIAAACRDVGARVRISRLREEGVGWDVVSDDSESPIIGGE